MRTLWIVCPVYRDVAAFLELRREALRSLEQLLFASPHQSRFVVVDDTGGMGLDVAFGNAVILCVLFAESEGIALRALRQRGADSAADRRVEQVGTNAARR